MTSTRTRILEAALACFVEHGAATTIEQVRATAGVSIGSLYHHVGDRRGLVAAVREWLLREYQTGFLAVLEDEDDPEVAIATTVRFHVGWCLARPDAARFLLAGPAWDPADDGGSGGDGTTGAGPAGTRDDGAPTSGLAAANRDFFRRVRTWLRPHVRYGAVRDVDVLTAYALWLGPAQERCRLWVTGRADPPDAAVVDVLADAAVRSLCIP